MSLKKQITHTSGVCHLHCRWSPNCHLRFKHLWNYQLLLGVKLNENLQTFLDTPVSNHTAPEDTWGPSCMFLYIRYIVADSLRPHGLQHASLPCPFLSPWACSSSYPLRGWCCPINLILCRLLLLLPSIFPSIRVFYSESALCNRWPKYWSFNFNISSSNEYSGLISFRVDWFGLLAVQGILKSLLQYHNLKASILRHSTFFIVQLSHPYVTTGKTKALTLRTFVGKVMSLLFNMLSRFIIAFLPKNKHLLISWLQPPSAVIL